MEDKEKYPKTDYFNVIGEVDVEGLIKKVNKISGTAWASENNNKPNKFAALADAQHIIFRFVKSFDNVYEYENKPIWKEFKDDISKLMESAAKSFNYTKYAFPRIMLAKLPAGGKITPHIDSMASFYIHKIHIPLTTNSKTLFYVDEKTMHMPKGQIVEVNNKRRHAATNDGDTDRIHLIFECYNMDDYGKNDAVQRKPFS